MLDHPSTRPTYPAPAPPPNSQPAATAPVAYLQLRDATQEAAEAADEFVAARQRWVAALARVSEAENEVKRAREQADI